MENKNLKELQKEECVKRLNLLIANGMGFKEPLKAFTKKNDVGIFERQNKTFKAIYQELYLNEGDEMYDKIIEAKENFESEYDAMVYLIQITHTNFGTMASIFYVSKNEEEWENDIEMLKEKSQYVYVANLDDKYCSEIGEIGFDYDKLCGGIYRTW